ncbi:MAG: hypothetical protein ACNA7W_09965 [Pseudomonadales bacterium]
MALAPLQFMTVAPAAPIRHSSSRKSDFDVLGPEFRPCCDRIAFLVIRLSRQGQEEPNLTDDQRGLQVSMTLDQYLAEAGSDKTRILSAAPTHQPTPLPRRLRPELTDARRDRADALSSA